MRNNIKWKQLIFFTNSNSATKGFENPYFSYHHSNIYFSMMFWFIFLNLVSIVTKNVKLY